MIPLRIHLLGSRLTSQFLLHCRVRPRNGRTYLPCSVTAETDEHRLTPSRGLHLFFYVSKVWFITLAHQPIDLECYTMSTTGIGPRMCLHYGILF